MAVSPLGRARGMCRNHSEIVFAVRDLILDRGAPADTVDSASRC
jgi:hypothetical protein